MATGISVHVGVNQVHAPGINVPALKGCENDAREMHRIAIAQHFTSGDPLLGENASYDNVVKAITDAAALLGNGDFFLFTFAGHGTQRDALVINEENDDKDETIVLHDRILLDNVFKFVLWPKFKPGVRILAISDSCNSGGAFFLTADGFDNLATEASKICHSSPLPSTEDKPIEEDVVSNGDGHLRGIRDFQKERLIELDPDFYRRELESLDLFPKPIINASLLVLAACEENGKTADGPTHGVFTQALMDVWQNGAFVGDYAVLKNEIQNRLPDQTPVLVPKGANPSFVTQRPFTIL